MLTYIGVLCLFVQPSQPWELHFNIFLHYSKVVVISSSHKYRQTQKLITNSYNLSYYLSILCLYWTHPLNIHSAGRKISEPLDLITGWTSFGSNNLKLMLPVATDQTCTTFRRNFEPFFLTELLQLSHILRMSGVNSSGGNSTASQGLGSDWTIPKATFSSFF